MFKYIFLIFLFISFNSLSAPLNIGNNATHITTGNATYDALSMGNNSTLIVVSGHVITITGNAFSSNGLGITVQTGAILNINGCLTGNNNFNLNVSGTLNIGCVDVDNNGFLTIQGTGTVNISGDLTTGQNTNINVQLNGDLLVSGNVTVGSGTSQTTVNGTFIIGGQYSGPVPTGSGEMDDVDQQFLPYSLPIILKDISIDCQKSELKWSTLSEWSTSHYLVFKSLDGENWSQVHKVDAVGYSQNQTDYVVNLKFDNQYYIKVLQFDVDGKKKEIGILSCIVDEQINTYPNPSQSDFFTHLDNTLKPGLYNMRIKDASNKLIYQKLIVKDSEKLVIPIYLEKSGCYLIEISDEEKVVCVIKHFVN